MPSKNSTKSLREEKKADLPKNSLTNYDVITLAEFGKQLKRLAGKYPSLVDELEDLIQALSINPTLGKSIGKGCFKIRLAVASKGKGKSGGSRVITYVKYTAETVYLLSIYDKNELSTITGAELDRLLALIR